MWMPIETYKKDGTIVLLKVEYEANDMQANPLEDTESVARTLGFNNFDHDGDDEWKLAGWDWPASGGGICPGGYEHHRTIRNGRHLGAVRARVQRPSRGRPNGASRRCRGAGLRAWPCAIGP